MDFCNLCFYFNNHGKCTNPSACHNEEEMEGFILKPIYAAAPEMYEALKEIVQAMEADLDKGEGLFDWVKDYGLNMAKQALAKAEGRTK